MRLLLTHRETSCCCWPSFCVVLCCSITFLFLLLSFCDRESWSIPRNSSLIPKGTFTFFSSCSIAHHILSHTHLFPPHKETRHDGVNQHRIHAGIRREEREEASVGFNTRIPSWYSQWTEHAIRRKRKGAGNFFSLHSKKRRLNTNEKKRLSFSPSDPSYACDVCVVCAIGI